MSNNPPMEFQNLHIGVACIREHLTVFYAGEHRDHTCPTNFAPVQAPVSTAFLVMYHALLFHPMEKSNIAGRSEGKQTRKPAKPIN
jgi:hypothetical protein